MDTYQSITLNCLCSMLLFNLDQFTSQMKIIQDSKFDLITMYKRRPNYKIHLYGSDILMEMKLADFLSLRDK